MNVNMKYICLRRTKPKKKNNEKEEKRVIMIKILPK